MRRPLMWSCLLGIAVCILWMRMQTAGEPAMDTYRDIVIKGRVSSSEIREKRTILYLSEVSDNGVSAEKSLLKNCIGVICYLQSEQALEAGDFVVLKGTLEAIEGARNPGGFSYKNFYRARGYSHRMWNAELVCVKKQRKNIYTFFKKVSNLFDDILAKYLSESDYGIMKALLLGDKSDVEDTRKTIYQEIGIYHILAISGLHVSFLGNLLYSALYKCRIPAPLCLAVSILFLLFYAVMTGFSLSTIRAFIMFIICMSGRIVYRTYDMLTALSVAAFMSVVYNPYICLDSGFQLSYLAVLGIAILFPSMPGVDFRRIRIVDSFWSSLSVTLLTLPVTCAIYNQISFYGIIANIMVLPSVSYLMFFGMAILFFHFFIPFLAQIFANGCHIFLHYYDVVVHFLIKLPFGNITVGKPEFMQIVIYLTGIILLGWIMQNRKRELYRKNLLLEQKKRILSEREFSEAAKRNRKIFWCQTALEALCLIGLVALLLIRPLKTTDKITVLDVGQGDGICLELGNEVYMIDGGSSNHETIGENVIYPFLRSKGISHISGWFFTHPDRDHMSAFLEYENQENITLERIYIPGNLWEEFKEIREIADINHIEVCILFAGDMLQLGKWSVQVLSPCQNTGYKDENDASLVLLFSNGTFQALMMGDAGLKAQESILDAGIKDVTFLKVAHHGSAVDTNTQSFLDTVSPGIAVISCARNNRYGHPHEETLQALELSGSRIYRTDMQGAITVRISEDCIGVMPYLTY